MTLIPAFEIGVWNAWILIIPMLIIFFFSMRVTAARESGRQIGDFELTKKEKRIINAVFLPMIIAFIYAVFLPLKSGTAWLYTGLIIYLFGVVFTIVTILNFATSAKDKVITKGLYSFTRNPMYISMLLMFIGVGVACSSWLFLLFILVLAILLNANLPAEERYCFHIYGDDYKKYTNRTPRWIGTPKS